MQNQYPKYIREHQERKAAEFRELARTWVPEKSLRAEILDSLTLQQQTVFMVFDYFMSTGGEDEVKRLIRFMSRALEMGAATMYWDEPPPSNN
jgi:hypothetical protein